MEPLAMAMAVNGRPAAAVLVSLSVACAHEVRPAYLQIDEVGPGRYHMLWRTPVLSGMRLPVVLQPPMRFAISPGPRCKSFPTPLSNAVSSTLALGDWQGSGSSSLGCRRPSRT